MYWPPLPARTGFFCRTVRRLILDTQSGGRLSMHIVVALDGVLANPLGPVLRRLNREYGLHVAKWQIRTWNEAIADTDIKTAIANFMLCRPSALNTPVVRGARQALLYLSSRHHVTVATDRAGAADEFTQEWLRLQDIPFHNYLNTNIAGSQALPGDLLVDGDPAHAIHFVDRGGRAILFRLPWNRSDTVITEQIGKGLILRARGWADVLRLIARLAGPELWYRGPEAYQRLLSQVPRPEPPPAQVPAPAAPTVKEPLP
jgi:5'(3')-deoxyribonucleotidase